MNRTKIIFFWKFTTVMVDVIVWINTMLVFEQSKELAHVAIFFKKKTLAFAIRIRREIGNSSTEFCEFI